MSPTRLTPSPPISSTRTNRASPHDGGSTNLLAPVKHVTTTTTIKINKNAARTQTEAQSTGGAFSHKPPGEVPARCGDAGTDDGKPESTDGRDTVVKSGRGEGR
eukprot:412906-Prorocentrum_minimum.AAC.5